MQIYEQLWQEAMAALELGRPQLDPYLLDKAADRRRGVSLKFGLPAAVQTRIKYFLDQLALEFSGQYFYSPGELHVTVLTLVSGTELWRKEIRDVPAFRNILSDILGHHPHFEVEFRGITATPNAVMIQGFPRGDTLENIRRDLRRGFAERGFASRLDRRYVNQAAHVTAMRFCRADADWKRLLEVLKANRQTSFGEMRVEALQLVWGDWYASADILRTLQVFSLSAAAPSSASKIIVRCD